MNIVPEDKIHNFHVNLGSHNRIPGTRYIRYIVLAQGKLIFTAEDGEILINSIYVPDINEFFDAVDILKKEAVKQRLLK